MNEIINNLTIYVMGRNTNILSLTNILNLQYLYPELKNKIFYVDDNSVDSTKELLESNNINYINFEISQDEINEFKLTNKYAERSVRSILKSKKTLENCSSSYAIIMHSDMFVLNNTFLQKMIKDLEKYRVVSVAHTKREEEKEFRMAQYICDMNNLQEKQQEYCKYYLDFLYKTDENQIWDGLTLFDLKYFKDNNLPFCDRLDIRNKYCFNNLFVDCFQDFQCFLIENNIPWISYDLFENTFLKNLVHIGHMSNINTSFIEDKQLLIAPSIVEKLGVSADCFKTEYGDVFNVSNSLVDLRKIYMKEFFKKKIYIDAFKILSKNSGLSMNYIKNGFLNGCVEK